MGAQKRREAGRRRGFTITTTLLVLALASAFTATAAAGATTFTESFTIPITTGFISCEGEVVFLAGDAHILTHGTLDAAGGVHAVTRESFASVHGVGTESGALYVAADAGMEIFNGKPNAAREDTFERSFRLVAQGGPSDAYAHVIGHLTTNANGEVTIDFIRFQVECQR